MLRSALQYVGSYNSEILLSRRAAMFWRRKKAGTLTMRHNDLLLAGSGGAEEEEMERITPKGYVPMIVGREEAGDEVERVLVHVRLLKEPSFLALLDMAAQKYGYRNAGVIRIPYSALRFRKMVSNISACSR